MDSLIEKLGETIGRTGEGAAWLRELPGLVPTIALRWSLRIGEPMTGEASCSWVATATTVEGADVVLKIGYPHMEAKHEIDGLAFWAGDPTVALLRADREANAMLLERCRPGAPLSASPEEEQDEIIARVLRRLWRAPTVPHTFRPLSEMVESWSAGIREDAESSPDTALVLEGLSAMRELASSSREAVLLATDLHAGNVLSDERQGWRVIDPKPFVGDPCYDATQHLLNCEERMQERPREVIARFAALLDMDEARVRRWAFARYAVRSGEDASARRIASRLSDR